MTELEQDPEYIAMRERQEAERLEAERLDRLAQEPVLEDLRKVGVNIDSVWHLYLFPDSRPQAIPVLLKHLTLDYPDRVLEGIGNGLYDRSARPWWDELREMMLTTDREAVRDRLAAVLSLCATRENYDDLLGFIKNNDLGPCRIYFLRPINRIGNRMKAGQGRAVVETVADDPDLGREATAILKGRSRSQ